MAQIDIKNCTIRFCDGRLATLAFGSSTTLVTFTAVSKHWGSRTQPTVAFVDPGISAALSVTVTGTDITVHLANSGSAITSTANDVAAAITASMAASALVTAVGGGAGVVSAHAAAPLTTGARTLVIKVGDGNLTYSEKKARQYTLDRGLLDNVRNADEDPVDVSLDLLWEFISAVNSSGTPTPEEALKKIGEASNWTTTASDICMPYTIDIELEDNANCSPEQREFTMFEEFNWESLAQDLKAGTIKLAGKCNKTTAQHYRIT